MRHAPFVLLLLAGCFPEDARFSTSTATDVKAGRYDAYLELEVRALLGPLVLKQDRCASDLVVTVDPDAESLIEGDAICDFTAFDPVDATLYGDVVGLPDVEGEIDAPPVEAAWSGIFLERDHFYGEATGTHPYRGGVHIEYDGWITGTWAAPLTSIPSGGQTTGR
jgi:hypothetical protein